MKNYNDTIGDRIRDLAVFYSGASINCATECHSVLSIVDIILLNKEARGRKMSFKTPGKNYSGSSVFRT